MKGPAYRIVTPRLVIRCWTPADAPLLKEAIDSSIEHILPWLPWAVREPEPLEAKVAMCRKWRGNFDLDEDYVYGVFSRDETQVLGGTGLHLRSGPGSREIGYWIRASHVRQGLATELAAALTRVGFEVDGVHRIEIHCDPENAASAAVPRRLGYVHEATLRASLERPDGSFRATMIWTKLATEHTAPLGGHLEAYGATGARLL